MTGIVPEPEPESPLGPDTMSETTLGGEMSTADAFVEGLADRSEPHATDTPVTATEG